MARIALAIVYLFVAAMALRPLMSSIFGGPEAGRFVIAAYLFYTVALLPLIYVAAKRAMPLAPRAAVYLAGALAYSLGNVFAAEPPWHAGFGWGPSLEYAFVAAIPLAIVNALPAFGLYFLALQYLSAAA